MNNIHSYDTNKHEQCQNIQDNLYDSRSFVSPFYYFIFVSFNQLKLGVDKQNHASTELFKPPN